MGERDRPPCSSATGPAGCGGGAALRVARHGAAWLFKRDLPPGSRSSPPPFRLLRTCSLSGGRRGSSPARWGSPPADRREGGRASVLSGWGPGPATATDTAPRPGLSQLSLGRSSPDSAAGTRRAARRRGRGAPPGMRPRPGAHPVPPWLQDPSSRGQSAHTRDPEPGKEPGTGVRGERSLRVGRHGQFGKGGTYCLLGCSCPPTAELDPPLSWAHSRTTGQLVGMVKRLGALFCRLERIFRTPWYHALF